MSLLQRSLQHARVRGIRCAVCRPATLASDQVGERAFSGPLQHATAELNQELHEVLGVAPESDAAFSGRGRGPLADSAALPAALSRTAADSHPSPRLTHVARDGKAAMVDVSQKPNTLRTATASARVLLGPAVFELVRANQIAKGDVLTVAQIAGVMAAKQTSTLIPLCHPLLLSKVAVQLSLDASEHAVDIEAGIATTGPTGVEMEALTAASVAALTVYDMCKAASKSIIISHVRLEAKAGGKSGVYSRPGCGPFHDEH